MTTAQTASYPFVTKVIDLFGDWLRQRRQLNELIKFEADPGELERIAREFGVTPQISICWSAKVRWRGRIAENAGGARHR